MSLPRGLKNKNPGNIIITPTLYVGEVWPSQDPRFKTFSHIEYGYRAIFKLLRTYISRGTNTIGKMISTWAPEPEAWKIRAYINNVVQTTGIPENRVISADDWNSLAKIVAAISGFENGVPANMQEVMQGMALAQQSSSGSGSAVPIKPDYTNYYIAAALAAAAALYFVYEDNKKPAA